MLWQRVAQMLQVRNMPGDAALSDLEADSEAEAPVVAPDWSLLSFQGLLGVLQVAVAVFTKVRYACHMFISKNRLIWILMQL